MTKWNRHKNMNASSPSNYQPTNINDMIKVMRIHIFTVKQQQQLRYCLPAEIWGSQRLLTWSRFMHCWWCASCVCVEVHIFTIFWKEGAIKAIFSLWNGPFKSAIPPLIGWCQTMLFVVKIDSTSACLIRCSWTSFKHSHQRLWCCRSQSM